MHFLRQFSISQINEAATTISEMNLSITEAVQEQAAQLNQSSETLGNLVSRFQV